MAESDFVGSKEQELIIKAYEALHDLRVRFVELKLPTHQISSARLAVAAMENIARFRHKNEEGFSEFSKSVK